MGIAPAAIVFVNNDLTDSVEDMLIRQLHIDELIDGATFDARVASDSDYPNQIKRSNLRVMVVRSFTEPQNRELADLVLFIKAGLATAIQNKFSKSHSTGPHVGHHNRHHHHWHHCRPIREGNTFQVVNIHWGQFGIF